MKTEEYFNISHLRTITRREEEISLDENIFYYTFNILLNLFYDPTIKKIPCHIPQTKLSYDIKNTIIFPYAKLKQEIDTIIPKMVNNLGCLIPGRKIIYQTKLLNLFQYNLYKDVRDNNLRFISKEIIKPEILEEELSQQLKKYTLPSLLRAVHKIIKSQSLVSTTLYNNDSFYCQVFYTIENRSHYKHINITTEKGNL